MLELVLIQLANSLLGGAALVMGPLVASVWTVIGEWLISPLNAWAKARLPAGTNKANVGAVRDAAFYVKMSVGNPAGLLSLAVLGGMVKAKPSTNLSPKLDVVIAGLALGMTITTWVVAGPVCLFPLLTGAWLLAKDHYEWSGNGKKWLVVVPPCKMLAAALFSELSIASHARTQEIPAYVELWSLCFTAECLLVCVAVVRGMRATPTERAKVYMVRLASVPLALLGWSWR